MHNFLITLNGLMGSLLLSLYVAGDHSWHTFLVLFLGIANVVFALAPWKRDC